MLDKTVAFSGWILSSLGPILPSSSSYFGLEGFELMQIAVATIAVKIAAPKAIFPLFSQILLPTFWNFSLTFWKKVLKTKEYGMNYN